MSKTSEVRPLQERLVALDVLRGFALFGVLLVNMLDFSGSALRANTLGARGSEFDQLVDVLIVMFAVVKFYLLFSFLFGVGFAVQMRRVEGSGRAFVAFYLRRLAVLFIIGLAHAILVWDGDILRLYALAGLLLLLVRHLATPILLGLALIITLGGLIFFGSMGSLEAISTVVGAQAVPLFMNGAYWELVAYRFGHVQTVDMQIPMVLVMFLLGLVAGRSGLLDDPARYTPFLRRWWKWALPVGLVGNGLLIVGFVANAPWLVSFGVYVGAPALSFVYAAAVLLNVDRLRGLAPVGQMALTNYLTQSLLATTLFYGYGFGLYDQLSPTLSAALVFIIFGAQIILSRVWLRTFRFGLVEWLWRSLTYGEKQPLKRNL